VAIHRYDAEHAASVNGGPDPAPLNGEVAAAGIEEFIIEFLPGLLARNDVEGMHSTLHVHATDGPLEWWVDLDAPSAARPEHAKADTAIRASRSDLLLWLTNRSLLGSLEVIGSQKSATGWIQLGR
jgi:hypothetical protein